MGGPITCPVFTGIMGTAGVGSAAFGTADVIEGIQDVEYGIYGDLTTKSFNPYKDILGEKAYYTVENITSGVAGTMMTFDMVYGVGRGVKNYLTAKNAAGVVEAETVEAIETAKISEIEMTSAVEAKTVEAAEIAELETSGAIKAQVAEVTQISEFEAAKTARISEMQAASVESISAEAGGEIAELESAEVGTELGGVNRGNNRPAWRQSEIDARIDFPEYQEQVSFINGKEVPYGTKGSVRPDFYKEGYSVDIKNYNIETQAGRNSLAKNIEKQYNKRIDNLPAGTKQAVQIDIRGQNVSDELLQSLYNDIMQRTNDGITIYFKMN